jgi:hypothetical protein
MLKTVASFTLLLGLAASAQAVTYSLASGFSNASNPNGVWSFTQGSTLLGQQTLVGSNALNPALANGVWGVGPNLDTAVPFVGKTTQNGAATAPYSNADFLAGQVIVHSANSGDALFIHWTAPAAGTVSYLGSAWYAHSPVVRANNVFVTLGGTPLSGPTLINNTSSQASPVLLPGLTSTLVAAGTVLSFEIRKDAAQAFGSITGLNLTVDFTASPVPEPATYGLLMAGLLGVGAVVRRRSAAQRA